MTYRYLKPRTYYEDQYDLHTIEECLWWYWNLKDDFEKHRKNKEFKKYSKKKYDEDVHKAVSYTINAIKIERFRHRAERINKWLERDQAIQDKFDNATAPEGVLCKFCSSTTKVTSKDFLHTYDEDSQVLFMFECIKCMKRQALFEDGSEWHYEPPKCPKCGNRLSHEMKRAKDDLITTYSCPNCSYKRREVDNFKKSDAEWKKREERDRNLLEKYREEFCYSEEVGTKAVLDADMLMRFVQDLKETEKKEKDPIYQKAKKLKILKVVQLKLLLEKALHKMGYLDLAFDKPEIDKYVIVGFSVNDTKDDREELVSESDLKKVIKATLEKTNWRLMSEGVYYRLGVLTGRLKAYEQEEDLMRIARKNDDKMEI